MLNVAVAVVVDPCLLDGSVDLEDGRLEDLHASASAFACRLLGIDIVACPREEPTVLVCTPLAVGGVAFVAHRRLDARVGLVRQGPQKQTHRTLDPGSCLGILAARLLPLPAGAHRVAASAQAAIAHLD